MVFSRLSNYPAALAGFFVTLTAVAVFCLPNVVAAEEPSMWTASQNPTVKVEEENFQPAYYEGEHCQTEMVKWKYWHQDGYWGPSYLKEQEEEQCATQTQYGKVTSHDYLQFLGDKKAYHIDMAHWGGALKVPNAKSYFYSSGIGNGYRGLFAIDNPVASFEVRDGATDSMQGIRLEKEYFLKEGVSARVLKNPVSGSHMSIRNLDASNDGSQLVVFQGSQAVKINPSNFEEMLAFPAEFPRYGPFSEEKADMAISNDGRYAVITSGFGGDFPIKFYDLSKCKPNPDNAAEKATNCEIKDMRDFMREQIPGFANASHLQFNSDATQLSMMVTVNNDANVMSQKRVSLTPPGVEVSSIEYMALGDSFVSGEGDTNGDNYYEPGTDGQLHPDEKCHLSKRSYPYLLSKSSNIGSTFFRSIACSGATKNDIVNNTEQYTGHFEQYSNLEPNDRKALKEDALRNYNLGRAAQIQFVEKYKPKVVTVGIGGNDMAFKDKLTACISSVVTNILASCAPATTEGNARASVGGQIKGLYTKLKELYKKLHEASKDTRIYAVGYPNIIKTGTACNINVPLDDSERIYAQEVVNYLNITIKKAAKDAGVGYINIQDALSGKELCAGLTENNGVNGIMTGNDIAGIVGNESFHPNERGHQAIANYIKSGTPNLLSNHDYCNGTGKTLCPSGKNNAPEPTDYFVYEHSSFIETVYNHSMVKSAIQYPGHVFNGVVGFFNPGSKMHFELHSDPVHLGEYIVDTNGNVNAELTIPDTIKPGIHELHAIGTAPSGEPIDQYKTILVAHSKTDADGDGIPNDSDKCAFVKPADIDKDKDDIDDACDPDIGAAPLPDKPTVVVPDYVNIQNQNEFEIFGKAEKNTTLHISVDDTDAATEKVTASVEIGDSEENLVNYSKKLNLSSLKDGEVTIEAKSKNENGESLPAALKVVKDTVAPSSEGKHSTPANTHGWHKTLVSAQIKSNDVGAGFTEITYKTEGALVTAQSKSNGSELAIPINKDGVTDITYTPKDKAGNIGKEQKTTIRLDRMQPNITLNKPRVPVLTHVLGDKFSGEVFDAGSGIDKVQAVLKKSNKQIVIQGGCSGGCVISKKWSAGINGLQSGIYTVIARAIDKAGNVKESQQIKVGIVDTSWLIPWW